MKSTIFFLVSSLAMLQAQNHYGRWYFGAEMGFTGFEDYSFDYDYYHTDTGGVSFGLIGGYQINRFLSVQIGRHHVNSIDVHIRHHDDEIYVSDSPNSDYRTTEFLVLGKLPLGRRVSIFGLCGLQHFDLDHEYIRDFEYQFPKTDGSEVVLGLGLEWFYNDNVFSRMTFRGSDINSKYSHYSHNNNVDFNQNQVSILFGYRFD